MSVKIAEIFVFGVPLLVESLYAYRSKSFKNFLNPFTLCYWAGLLSRIILHVYEYNAAEIADTNLAIRIVLDLVSGVFIVVYLLSRGMFVLFEISGEGINHPTCKTIKKHYVLLLILVIGLMAFNAGLPLFIRLYLWYKFQ